MPGIVLPEYPYGHAKNEDYAYDKWRDEQDEKERTKMKDDGGPAFPINGQYNEIISLRGMSMRDYFAAAALTGILACFREYKEAVTGVTRIALAYEYADLMLAERAKE